MDTRITMRRLEVFCVVVEEGGVTRAAERMYIAQPAVSTQIHSLQESLGVTLFVRRGGRLELTEAGRRAYSWARETLARSLELDRELHGLEEGVSGSAVVAASMAVGSYLLPSILTGLRAKREGAEITLTIGQPRQALRDVDIGHADLAVLGWDEQEVSSQMRVEHLHDEPLVVIVSGQSDTNGSLTLAEAAALPHAGVPHGVAFDHLVTRQLRAHGIDSLNVVIRLGHAEPIKQAVAERHWAAFMPLYSVRRELADGTLRAIPVTNARLVEPITMFWRTAKAFSRLQADVLDAFRGLSAADDERDGAGLCSDSVPRNDLDVAKRATPSAASDAKRE